MESDLSCLGSGQRGLITALRFSGGKRRRLMELGAYPRGHGDGPAEGAFGGAVSYEVMGTVIALRSADARRIGIEIIQ